VVRVVLPDVVTANVDTASADAMHSAANDFTVFSCHLDRPPSLLGAPGEKVHQHLIDATSRVQVGDR
jgi:hypothetical protein